MLYLIFVFFFSSRRRHTISLCDWSSDVCSSDLQSGHSSQTGREFHRIAGRALQALELPREVGPVGLEARSEERRVGKELRTRWSSNVEDNKTIDVKECVINIHKV